jgi:hypothetical protein
MKKWTGMLALALTLVMAMGLALPAYAEETLEDMLVKAYQEEQAVLAQYEAMLDAFGDVRPLVNIAQAERNHISHLEILLKAYDIALPAAPEKDSVQAPATIAEAVQLAIKLEQDDMALYEAYLQQELPDDVKFVFERLRLASENHLRALERARVGAGNQPGGVQPGRGRQDAAPGGKAPGMGRYGYAQDGNQTPPRGRGGAGQDKAPGLNRRQSPRDNAPGGRQGRQGGGRGR